MNITRCPPGARCLPSPSEDRYQPISPNRVVVRISNDTKMFEFGTGRPVVKIGEGYFIDTYRTDREDGGMLW